jgi:beta-lactamase class A
MTDPIDRRLRDVFASAGARGYLHAVDLDRGGEVGVDADEPVVSASVFKLPILVEVYRQAAAGKLDLDERITVTADQRSPGPTGLSVFADPVELSLRDLATSMMSVSDNTATDVVLERVGLDAVHATLRTLGRRRTRILEDCRTLIASAVEELGEDGAEGLVRGTVDPARLAGLRVLDPARTNTTTPRDTTALLVQIWRDEAADARTCAEIRRVLGLQIWPHRLSSGFPAAVKVSGKTGTLPSVRNEVGVVEYPDGGRFAVAVFTRAASYENRQPAVDASIGTAARLAIDHLVRANELPDEVEPLGPTSTAGV